MSVASQLEQLETDITNAYSAIDTKGGTIPAHKNTNNLATAINSISTGGGGGSASDYFYSQPSQDFYNALALIKQFPTIDCSQRENMDYFFDGCSSITTLPTLTNTSDITSCTNLASNCPALVNVPYYYFPNCNGMNLSGAFYDSELLSDQSLTNIMQMCIDCDNSDYIDPPRLADVVNFDVAQRAENMPNYQDFLDAGWIIDEWH
jgi:hypothetical protein